MKKNKLALKVLSVGLIILSFIACESDYATVDSDVLNSDIATNFQIKDTLYSITTYTKPLDPVQTNNSLNISTLGIYDDAYGRTTSSFVTQLTPTTYNPTFGDDVEIDSVVVTIPYFNTITGTDDDGNTTYSLDSVFSNGDNYDNLKLRIFENNYLIRDFDPNGSFDENQAYYSDKTVSNSETISTTALQGEELTFVDYDEQTGSIMSVVGNEIEISDEGYSLKDVNNLDDNGDKTLISNEAPAIRIMLDPAYWENKIIAKEGDIVLSNENNFENYFRGLYFTAEAVNADGTGSYLILNTGSTNNANVTIYYSKSPTSTTDGEEEERETSTYVLNLGSNKINFLENDFTLPINEGDPASGDSKIYLKGGEGSIAGVKLFDGIDTETGLTNFEKFRNDFVNLEDNEFKSSKRLVNEANLVFYVDRDQLDLLNEDNKNEPARLYLYDAVNNTPLLDYYLDATNSSTPYLSKVNHLGPLQRVNDNANEEGVKYKLKITEHINNLLLRDSTNVELGLAVSLNVNIEDPSISGSQSKVRTLDNSDLSVPTGSVLSPRGTILHGNNTTDETKRVYLEIYYTDPNN
ncbi:DUF4270 domain-containing protein [Winogradskyella undariae]|uniref:DUF4270 domain-containing protein n=1 Tax=Winogradskyella undariae TaxID=1285465 RepID=UPI0015C8551A|nr:DUF4270 domain-containing protein [Winogradskyella undariae]